MAVATVSSTLGVSGVTTLGDNMIMTKSTAAITHSGTSLTISSSGFVDVENVRFTGADIGINGVNDLIKLANTGVSIVTNGKFDVGPTSASRKFTVIASSGDTSISGTLGVTGATTLGVVQTGAATLASAIVSGTLQSGAANLASATVSGTLGVTGATTLAVVQTGAATLASAIVTGSLQSGAATLASASVNGALTVTGLTSMATATVSSTLDVTGVTTLKEDVSMTKAAATISHTGTSLTISSTGFVEVESVKFTGATIGIGLTADVIALATTGARVTGKLEVGTTGARNFVVTKDGDTTVSGTLGVTGATTLAGVQTGAATLASAIVTGTLQSGAATLASATVNGLTSMATATVSSTLAVTGVTTLKEDVSMTKPIAEISHSGTSLTIKSSGFVDVENVRFTGADIGINGVNDLIKLANTGVSIVTNGKFDVGPTSASRKFTVIASSGDTSISGTLGVTGLSALSDATVSGTLGVSGATAMSSASLSSTLTVNGLATLKDGLTLEKDTTSMLHTGNTGLQISSTTGFVEVESVRFTNLQLGVGATPIITLSTSGIGVTGTLQTSGLSTLASLKVDGTTNLAGATVTGTTGMAVATVSSTLGVSGVTTLGDNMIMTKSTAAITHSGTSLTISSSGFVDVENVRFTGANIGVNGAPNPLIALASAGVTVTGTLGVSAAANIGSAVVSTTLQVNGLATLASATVNGATSLSTATLSSTLTVDGLATLKDSLTLEKDTTALTHTGNTGLQISSTNGYVQVQSVKFTGATIGIGTRVNVIALATTGASVTGTLQTSGLATLHSATVTNALQVNGLSTLASATVNGATSMATATVSSTLDVTGVTTLREDVAMTKPIAEISHTGTSLAITSTGYVEVESMRFAGPIIGLGAANKITLTASGATVSGTFGVSALASLASATLSSTLVVSGVATFGEDVALNKGVAAISHTGTSLTISSNGFVAVQSVQFSGGNMGVQGAANIIALSNAGGVRRASVTGKLSSTSDFEVGASKFTVAGGTGNTVISGTLASGATTVTGALSSTGNFEVGATGARKFTVAAGNGDTVVSGTLNSGAATLASAIVTGTLQSGAATLASATVNGALSATGNLDVGAAIARKFTVAAGTGDTDISGTLGVTGATKLTSAALSTTLTVDGLTTIKNGLTLEMPTTLVTHTGSGGGAALKISSTNAYVEVETVQFAGSSIGVSGAPSLMALSSSGVGITGALQVSTTATLANAVVSNALTVNGASIFKDVTVSGNFNLVSAQMSTTLGVSGVTTLSDNMIMTKPTAAITHSGTSLTISSSGFVDVEDVRFTGPIIGFGASNVITLAAGSATVTGSITVTGSASMQTTLTVGGLSNLAAAALSGTLSVTGATTLKNDVTLEKDLTALTHTGTTGLKITSNRYVEVESVKFTGSNIGIGTTVNVIALATTGVSVTGTLQTSGLATLHSATVTNQASLGSAVVSTTLQVNGLATLASATVNGATSLSTATLSSTLTVNGLATLKDAIVMDKDTALLTHTGTTGLKITSTNINAYVEVEALRFKELTIGVGATSIIALATTGASVTGTLQTSGLATLASATVTTTMGVGGDFNVNGNFQVTASSGNTVVSGLLAVSGAHSDSSKELYVNGDIFATGTSTSASDSRFKRDVNIIDGVLGLIRDVRPVTFNFKTEEYPEKRFPESTQVGFLAQELEESLPLLVSTDDVGFKGVAYERAGVYALAGVKELDAAVRAQATRIETLEAEARERAEAHESIVAELEAKLAKVIGTVQELAKRVEE
jgi:hypothetical protein